ncbi:MAG: alpha/beta fold hydrolase [Anaerolineae bacterium]|nr:alpha/beta fold hydrolase [Anaerolineae bacterium]
MTPKLSKRLMRWIGMLILSVIVGLYLVLPVAFGVAAVFPTQESVGAPPAGFTTITITTGDNVALDAWYAPPTNGAVIILVHGAGNSRESLRRYAALFTQHGYGVLALDLRGHGNSEGTTNRLGWQGTADISAAAAYLQTQPEVTHIGALGLSMGAEVLLGAASTVPAIQGIVADGATQRCLDELRALESNRPLYRNFTARIFFLTVQLLSGDDPPIPPLLDSMIAADTTRFLLIAAGTNEEEIDYNELFAETVGERAALWIAPDAKHTGAFARYPAEYEERVIAFFDGVLLGQQNE